MRPLFSLSLAVISLLSLPTIGHARGGASGGSHSISSHATGLPASGSYGTGSSSSSHSVSGYTTKTGKVVAPAHATNPNTTQKDNYTAKGNINPYTGKVGTKPALQ